MQPLWTTRVFLWIVYGDGMLEKIDPAKDKIVYRSEQLKAYTPKPTLRYRLFADKDNDLWIFPKGESRGVFYFKPSQNSLLPIHREAASIRLNNNLVNAVTQDDKGLIWIATDHGGINLLTKKDFSIKYLVNNENDPHSLSQNSVNTIYKDRSGIIWIGTSKKGVNKFHDDDLRFPLYQHQPGNPKSLVYNDVNKFVEDKHGNLWIGTNGGGLLYWNRASGTFTQYLNSPSNAASLSNNIVVSLCIDHEDKLWIGTYFGGLDCFDGKKFIHHRHNEQNPASLADDRVWEIFEDRQHRLWVGTLTEGLDLFDRADQTFIHYKQGNTARSLRSGYVCSILEDRSGDIWLGTSFGIAVLNEQTGLFRHFEHREGDKTSLSHNSVIELLEDSRGLIWAATRDGLDVYDPVKKSFCTFRMEDGLPDNCILTVVEDNNHNLWVTTPGGISNVVVSTNEQQALTLRFKNYNENDGLQGRQFNENATCKLQSGELVVGGANGFNLFQPTKTGEAKTAPQPVLTDLQIFNSSVAIGNEYNGRVVLPQSVAEAKEITLKYSQNVFTVEFSALAFLSADKIKYAYKLEGFNNEWLITDAKARKAAFTNLSPGTYRLLIKASNEDGVWSSQPLALAIHILPPFYLTTLAFLIYALLFVAALWFARKLTIRRAHAKFSLEQERREAQRLHELDMMKIKFFTNVSHDFRTPLSLIITPIEKLIKHEREANDKSQLQLVHRNARRLLNLVNQLMDFRKLEEQELKLTKTDGDILRFIKEISFSFSDMAENKKIAFAVQAPDETLFTSFDHDKLERILFNLLSNAFKFTPAGGAVKVLVEMNNVQGEIFLQIKVMDTGIGIAAAMHEKIFERFFQNEVPGSLVNPGSGIGLAITREFVRMYGGTIKVESDLGKGSTFTVLLPVSPIAVNDTDLIEPPAEEDAGEQPLYKPAGTPVFEKMLKGQRKTVLLVEDSDDFRFYIKDNLKAYYNIIEAPNGKAGWQKALAEHPDLIVCDISMPEMNGVELCQKLKEDSRTSFIPVILLTALTGEEQQIAGLQTGASDYMTKPFNFEILLSKIRNLLVQQESFKKTYQKQVLAQPTQLPVAESADEKFMRQVVAITEKNMANADFSVEEMSRELLMDRAALYRKLFSLSGKPPLEFIRSFRLKRAAELLRKKELTVAEVAYEVGFINPKYFSKLFKQEFQVLPSVYQNAEKEQV